MEGEKRMPEVRKKLCEELQFAVEIGRCAFGAEHFLVEALACLRSKGVLHAHEVVYLEGLEAAEQQHAEALLVGVKSFATMNERQECGMTAVYGLGESIPVLLVEVWLVGAGKCAAETLCNVGLGKQRFLLTRMGVL